MLAQRDEHLLLGTVPLLAGPDDGVMQELGARLHELHGETELLVKVATMKLGLPAFALMASTSAPVARAFSRAFSKSG